MWDVVTNGSSLSPPFQPLKIGLLLLLKETQIHLLNIYALNLPSFLKEIYSYRWENLQKLHRKQQNWIMHLDELLH